MPVPFVGLTGSLGAGKSTALAACERLGAAVLNSDLVVHQLYETEAVKTALRLRWGAAVFDGDEVDRQAIGRLVFADSDKRVWLQGMLWPLTGQRTEAFRSEIEARTPPPRAGVVETPMLFEAGAEDRFDATVAIVADDALRAERLALRDQDDLAARERVQLSQAEKAARATFTVVNDGTIEELEGKLAEILATLAG
jgi:dephospho-CoA kinase